MSALRHFVNYIRWHYGTALMDLFYIAKNYLWGVGHVFSVGILLQTLFTPWHRMGSHTTTFLNNPMEFFGDLLVNIFMRVLGFLSRVLLLALALVVASIELSIFALFFAFWIILPVILIKLFISGITLLFS